MKKQASSQRSAPTPKPSKPSKTAASSNKTGSPARAGASVGNQKSPLKSSARGDKSVPKNNLTPRPAPVRPAQCRVVAVCNQKGGCGKTTTVINVAAGLAGLGMRVLVVDLDSQCNATSGLGLEPDDVEKSIFDLLVDPKSTSPEDVILATDLETLHVAPASIELSEFESRVAAEIGRENRLKKALAPLLPLYDFILIDTPPSLGLLSVNALNAASEVHIAMQAQPFAFDGLNLLLNTIHLIQEELNPRLRISGIIITMFDNRTRISREIVDKVCALEELAGQVFKTVIRQNIKLAEASRSRKPIMSYDPHCTGADDYLSLCHEICSPVDSSTARITESTPHAQSEVTQ